MCCCRPMASIVSMKIEASMLFSLLTCRLKSPASIMLLWFVKTSVSHLVILNRNIALVIGCFVE